MSLFSRFFGSGEKDDGNTPLIANPDIKEPLSLQILFSDAEPLDPASLTRALQTYHRSMSKARCEFDPDLNKEGKVLGLLGWKKHVIRCVGFDIPMPAEAVEACVAPSHYPEELKERARQHQAHLLLYYAGQEDSPLEQYVALTAVSGVLSQFGALVVLNESAHTSFPAAALARDEASSDMMELLRSLPLPVLYCGFVKYNVEDVPGVWMRTHGANLLGWPDLAVHAEGHHEGQHYFEMFDSVLRYLLDSDAHLAAGHTMQIDQNAYMRLRKPNDLEEFLHSDDELLVVEIIGPDEINS